MQKLSVKEAKAGILRCLRDNFTVEAACLMVGKSVKSYEYYRRSDSEFQASVTRIFQLRGGATRPTVPNFPQFSEKYLGMKLFNHQLQWTDLLDGKEPRNLHPKQRYEPRSKRLLCVNTAPFHAKSMTLSINYVTWRIVENPNIRIIIISKTATMAKKFLGAVKDRLDSNVHQFAELKQDFAPAEGFEHNSTEWRQDRIYINPDLRDRGEKDPTCEALGIGQQIYGARADLIIMDDCVVLDNAHEYEKQINWIQKEVFSRLEKNGKLLLIGTRLTAQDLYSEILKPTWYAKGKTPWTYLTQPAVLEMAEDPKDWVTLWPWTNVKPMLLDDGDVLPETDERGYYPMWNGPALDEVRDNNTSENWSRVYQQEQISESMTFTSPMLDGCTNELRVPGPMVDGRRGHRPGGMAGLYVIAGLDPAPTNYTAAVVIGVDRATGRRYLLDVWNKHGALPREVRDMVKAWTIRYGILEWRIEENGLNKWVSQDEEIVKWCRSRGTGVFGHLTNQNKWDPQYGIATMANLLLGYESGINMLELPSRRGHFGMQSLYEQAIAWYPTPSSIKMPVQDTLMALWFAELRARTIADEMDQTTHVESEYHSDMDREMQITVDLDELLARRHAGDNGVIALDDWFAHNAPSGSPSTWGR